MPRQGSSGPRKQRRSKGRVTSHPILAQDEIRNNAIAIANTIDPTNLANTQPNETSIIPYDATIANAPRPRNNFENVPIKEDHLKMAHNTLSHDRKVEVKRNLRNRIKSIIVWIEKEYFEHSRHVVFELTPEELNDPTRYYWKNKKDLYYNRLSHTVFQAYLACHNKYPNDPGRHYTYSQMRKYYDALLYGAEQSRRYLTIEFTIQMYNYYICLAKEKNKRETRRKPDD